jgi:hypothetical protein
VTVERWDEVADQFVANLSLVNAQVRTHVLHHHLTSHLTSRATIVDIGGGDGRASLGV